MVISAGLVLLGLFVALGPSRAAAAKAFIPVWFLAALANLWIGVSRAGYTVAQEAPILLVVFGVPAAVAAWLWRRG
jgi:hypothetical protein